MKKLMHEIKTIARISSYFAIVFVVMMVMKKLYLEDYDIAFYGLSQALIGALIMAKVIVLMDLISFGEWLKRLPSIYDVVFRTILYTIGVALVIILEKAFEARHKAGGFSEGISYVLSHRDIYHVWATTIGISLSLFAYNAFSVFQKRLGEKGVYKLFFTITLNQLEDKSDAHSVVTSL
jgi:hypothetical protein